MNIPELIEMIYDNFNGHDILYLVDMWDVVQDIPNLRVHDHETKMFRGSDEVLPFLLECDTNLWELMDWSLPNFQVACDQQNWYKDDFGDYKQMLGTVSITLRRYNV